MDTDVEYQIKIERLEAALIKYIERYGMSDSAREALAQVEEISRQSIVEPSLKLVTPI
ncbi:MAG: hypothetical protein OSA52_00990 [Yoonia sp.]|nr:hypothetical protein [Yoonia sp.]